MAAQEKNQAVQSSGFPDQVGLTKVPYYITISGRKKYAREYQILLQEQHHFTTMENTQQASITYGIAATIPQVFGDYSSLKVEVGVTFPGDPDNLEEEINAYDERLDAIVTTKVNHVLKSQGKEGLSLG